MKENIRYLASDIAHPFSVEIAGISYCDASYRIKREKSPIWVFEYIIAGQGTVCEQKNVFQAQKGDVYILHQGKNHEYYSDALNPWIKIWFNVKGPVVESLLQAYGLATVNHLTGFSAEMETFFRRFLASTYSNADLYTIFDRCSLIFQEILQMLSRRMPQKTIPGEAEILHDFIMRNLTVPVSLEDMAKRIFRSKAYIIKIFQSAYQQTPYAYLIRRRIDAARHLLRETHMSVAEIADQLCFADQHYFANVFRRFTGLSPRQYRRSEVNVKYNSDITG